MISEQNGCGCTQNIFLVADEHVTPISRGKYLQIVIAHHCVFEQVQKLLYAFDDIFKIDAFFWISVTFGKLLNKQPSYFPQHAALVGKVPFDNGRKLHEDL